MNSAILIGRKDHEVYFVGLSGRECRTGRNARKRAEIALRELHPGFSGTCAFDAREFRAGNARWLMITVMNRADLDEYRALYPFRPLVTVSSALAADPRFAELPVTRYGDELVGYSPERAEPISVPVTDEALRRSYPEAQFPRARAIRRAEVFANPVHATVRRVAAGVALAGAVFAVSSFVSAATGPSGMNPRSPTASTSTPSGLPYSMAAQTEQPAPLPDAFSVLLDVSRAVISSRGACDRFSFDESARNPVRIDARGCDALALKAALDKIPYLECGRVGRVEYREGVPFFSLAAGYAGMTHAETSIAAVPADDIFFSFASYASGRRISGNVVPKAAEIDSAGANRVSYAISADGLPSFLRDVASRSASSGLRVRSISVAVDRARRSFDVSCSVVVDLTRSPLTQPQDFSEVLIAAGIPAAGLTVVGVNARTPDVSARVGSISGVDGSRSLFYRKDDGKIFEMEE